MPIYQALRIKYRASNGTPYTVKLHRPKYFQTKNGIVIRGEQRQKHLQWRRTILVSTILGIEVANPVGRPMLSKKEKRGQWIACRVNEAEFQLITGAIAMSGLDKNKWIRQKLLAAARRA